MKNWLHRPNSLIYSNMPWIDCIEVHVFQHSILEQRPQNHTTRAAAEIGDLSGVSVSEISRLIERGSDFYSTSRRMTGL